MAHGPAGHIVTLIVEPKPTGRLFSAAANDYIAVGPTGVASLTGALTFAAIMYKVATGDSKNIISGDGELAFGPDVNNGDVVNYYNSGSSSKGVTAVPNGAVVLIAMTKTAGTSTPRMHIINLTSPGSPVHENGDAALGNFSGAMSLTNIGRWYAGSDFSQGEIFVVGAFNAALTDLEIEGLAVGLYSWNKASTKGLWKLGTTPVDDVSASNQDSSSITGTSLSFRTVPGFDWSLTAPPAPPPVGPMVGVLRLEDGSEILQEVGNPPTFVAVGAENFTSSAIPVTPQVPAGVAGDLLILWWESDTSTDVAVASGYTAGLHGNYGASNHAYGFLYKFDSTTGGGSQTVTGLTATPFTDTFITRYRAVDPNNPINAAMLDPAGAVASNLTTSRPDTVEIVAITDDLGVTNSPPAGWTGRLTTAGGNFFAGDRVLTPFGKSGTSSWPHNGTNNGIIHIALNGIPSTVKEPLHLVLESGVAGSWTGSGTALTEDGFQVLLEDGTSKVLFEATALTALVQEAGRYWLTEAGDHVLLESAGAAGGSRSTSDAAGGSDAATRQSVYTRAVSDNAVATDAATRLVVQARNASDTATATDVVTRGAMTMARTCSDSAPATDAVTKTTVRSRTTSDTAAATDSNTVAFTQARTTSDSAPATDSAVRGGMVLGRTSTDSAPATDATTRSRVSARTSADSAPATDSNTVSFSRSRTTSDSAPATDAAVRSAMALVRSTTDTTAATDSVTRVVIRTRSVTDSAPATDATTRTTSGTRATSDTASATDAATRGSLTRARTCSDSSPATDNASTGGPQSRSASDSAPATDSAVRTQARNRTSADTAAATDAATRVVVRARTVSDSAPATDTVARSALVMLRAVADTAGASDAVVKVSLRSRSTSDSAPATDSNVISLARFRTTSDNAFATDTVVRGPMHLARFVTDDAPAVDIAFLDHADQPKSLALTVFGFRTSGMLTGARSSGTEVGATTSGAEVGVRP